ncbi:hypothetical protein KIL84_001279 [Mauremys mutica]|uniref:Uncharacterized protein n=1 Tax=Mauremys mutica TaxID=74926 RepID=A0A9D4ATZ0_9SAUR|nr:hypothetical protein KIL84_001279 [Mauremys mutica]
MFMQHLSHRTSFTKPSYPSPMCMLQAHAVDSGWHQSQLIFQHSIISLYASFRVYRECLKPPWPLTLLAYFFVCVFFFNVPGRCRKKQKLEYDCPALSACMTALLARHQTDTICNN